MKIWSNFLYSIPILVLVPLICAITGFLTISIFSNSFLGAFGAVDSLFFPGVPLALLFFIAGFFLSQFRKYIYVAAILAPVLWVAPLSYLLIRPTPRVLFHRLIGRLIPPSVSDLKSYVRWIGPDHDFALCFKISDTEKKEIISRRGMKREYKDVAGKILQRALDTEPNWPTPAKPDSLESYLVKTGPEAEHYALYDTATGIMYYMER